MGVKALRLQSISECEMAGLKVFLALCCIAATSAVQLERKPFKRLIPADVLRDFRDSCFASTKCKVFANQETWSLAPFRGQSKCVKLKSGRLAEEVTDCCPVYDCEEGTEVVYVTPPSTKKAEKKEGE